MSRLRTLGFVALGLLAAALIAIPVAYALDMRAHDGEVARNVRLLSGDVGGLRVPALAARVERAAELVRGAQVRVDAPGGGFTSTTEEMGVTLDVEATQRAALDVGRTGALAARVWGWLVGLVRGRDVPVAVRVDTDRVHRVVAEKDRGRTPPREPTIRLGTSGFEAVEGKPGRGIDPRDVIDGIRDKARGGVPIAVEVERGEVEPRIPLEEAERLARQAWELTDEPLPVAAGDDRADVPVKTLRSWIGAEASGGTLRLDVDEEKALPDLAELLADAGTRPLETRFVVENGAVRIIPGRHGTGCCDAGAAGLIEAALVDGAPSRVKLPLRTVEPKLSAEEAERLEIKEPVATFRTEHPAGQPRVANIHRIADLVRGQVIEPGEAFSVNGFVGRRTTAKGFVPAPVIENGFFAEDVGGGISQFATTLFNAAFFAGLTFDEYQAHSIYISRYPYGREATLSYPKPDLKIRNPSPYGVLIWPTYTDSSITVTLYSTKWVEVEQTGQTKEQRGACTRVRTERTRRFLQDGSTKVDFVSALYRPGEGVNC